MSAAELKRLRAAKGKWCFPDGVRCLRKDRIKVLEAIQPKAKAKGKTDAKSKESTTDEA
jgi:hypothetical protein